MRTAFFCAASALAVGLAAALGSTAANAGDACWNSSQLHYKAGDEVVGYNRRALVDPPPLASSATSSSPFRWRGVLRRVDLPPGQKYVALTFDLCEQPHEVSGYQGRIVDYLRKNNIHATFFAGGKWLLTHSSRAEQLIAEPGIEVANHTWEHRNLRLLSGSALDDEIRHVQQAHRMLQGDLTGKQCLAPQNQKRVKASRMTLFRFPFGACNPRALRAVEAAGLRAVQWDVSSADPWKGQTAALMVREVVNRVRPGSIVLFHANGRGWHTDQAVPVIVERLRAQGYKFVTVSELLRIPGARPVVSETCYDAKPGDTDRYDKLARMLDVRHSKIVERLKRSGAGGASRMPPSLVVSPLPAVQSAPVVPARKREPFPSPFEPR